MIEPKFPNPDRHNCKLCDNICYSKKGRPCRSCQTANNKGKYYGDRFKR